MAKIPDFRGFCPDMSRKGPEYPASIDDSIYWPGTSYQPVTHPKSCPNLTVPLTQRRHRLRAREWPRPPRRDPHTRLIAQLLERAGPVSSVIATSSRPWASATFLGSRHIILLKIGGADHSARTDQLSETLADAEFTIAGHIVADICIDERLVRAVVKTTNEAEEAQPDTETLLRLSILTIEDW